MSINPIRKTTALEQLCTALSKGKVNDVKAILQAGIIDVDQRHADGGTLLTLAAQNGRLKVVECLVKDAKATVDKTKKIVIEGSARQYGLTPLWCAASCGHNRTVVFLLKAGANARRCFPPSTPWSFDTGGHNPAVTTTLLAASYDPAATAKRCAWDRQASRTIQAAHRMQMHWLKVGLSLCMTDIHAEIHTLFIIAMKHQDQHATDPSSDAAKFMAIFTPLPPEIQFAISQAASPHVLNAMLANAERAPAPPPDDYWTWVAAAAKGRPVIDHLRFFPDTVKRKAERWIWTGNHPRPTPAHLNTYSRRFSAAQPPRPQVETL